MTTLSPEQQNTYEFRSYATVTATFAGGAFCVAETNGQSAFIPAGVVRGAGLAEGDKIDALFARNLLGQKRNPYVVRRCVRLDGVHPITPVSVLNALETSGGAWTAEDVADELVDTAATETDIKRAETVLEFLYFTDAYKIAKVVEFTSPRMPGGRVWYTTYAQDCDYSEWEEA